jgi:hypothetical protein
MFASPAFTGVPTAPTAVAGTNTTQLATTQYVRTEVANLVSSAPGALDTLDELAAALGDDASFAATVTTSIGLKAPLESPAFTGTVTGITKTMVGLGNVVNETKATAFTNPAFTGTPTAPTAAATTNTTQIATTAFVQQEITSGAAAPYATSSTKGVVRISVVGTTLNIFTTA